MAIDPIQLTKDIRQAYTRYLTSAFRVNDADLREKFQAEVKEFGFTNGPIIEATPPFKTSATLTDLIEQEILCGSFRKLADHVAPHPLYVHQEKALRKVLSGRNVIVTSGTGSGKTECFLIPIYNYLLREAEEGRLSPGVRALILYPMNALVNDQLRRLRQTARIIEDKLPGVLLTFGRYVGDTEQDRERALDKFVRENPGIEPVKSEYLSREEMRETPPHILITNYAMLEYLLLRPKDTPLFDGKFAHSWKFLVLDEIHSYNGAMGMEIAMLIRRLKNRVTKPGDLRCVATSATLIKEEEDLARVARFASTIFDEKFEWAADDSTRQDILKGEREPLELVSGEADFPTMLYGELEEIVMKTDETEQVERCCEAAASAGVEPGLLETAKERSAGEPRLFLYEFLSQDRRFWKLRQFLDGGAKNWADCIEYVYGKDNVSGFDKDSLLGLVNLSVRARKDGQAAPLLPARYHLFIRAPEGAFVAFYPENRVYLDRREKSADEFPVFELATCHRCGQEYLLGHIDDDSKLKHSFSEIDTQRVNKYFLLLPDSESVENDEDQEIAVPEEVAGKGKVYRLCVRCGHLTEGLLTCECKEAGIRRTIMEIVPGEKGLNKCYLCGYVGAGAVREFTFQQDAPAAVLVTAVYQKLGNGGRHRKKILTFSDSRQDAAFFAPYLEYTYNRILFRRLIVEALEKNVPLDDYRLNSLSDDVLGLAEDMHIFDQSLDRRERKKEVWRWILQDFAGIWDRKNSPEGVSLLTFKPIFPSGWDPIADFGETPWNLTRQDAVALYWGLLNTLRFNMAISFPDNGPSPQDEFFTPRNREYRFRGDGSDKKKGIYSFLPALGKTNTRLKYLKNILGSSMTDQHDVYDVCRRVLCRVWDDLRENWVGSGLVQSHVSGEGVVYQLDYRYWQIIMREGDFKWHMCNRCGIASATSVRGACPTFNCGGNLEPIDEAKQLQLVRNHYYHLYTNLKADSMKCHEHTAQLTADYAAQVQQEFVRGGINVLSCSTTFELGVDLGDLEVIFLRNVPPQPSNYIQRAGRAGRGRDSVGFTLTFAQLRSHDLTYFRNPINMVEGRIKPPVVDLTNERIIRRHVHSVVLSAFFRQFPEFFGTVDSLFHLDGGGETGIREVRNYVEGRPEVLLSTLKAVVPRQLQPLFGLEEWVWVEEFVGQAGVLTLARDKIADECKNLDDFLNKKLEEFSRPSTDQKTRNRLNHDMDWASKRKQTIERKALIDFLSSSNVIPKYGFPVDVVDLAMLHHAAEAKNVQLERDLKIAIAEFAPGSQVVANGFIWESAGLRLVRNREWPLFWYGICPQCDVFCIEPGTIDDTPPVLVCPEHGELNRQHINRMIDPVFGFVTDREAKPRKPAESRPKREYSTRPYFCISKYKQPEEKTFVFETAELHCQYYSSEGELAVICRGKRGMGFWICFSCGRALSARQQKHTSPFGAECKGTLKRVHLGHKFKTDVLSVAIEPVVHGDYGFWLSLLYAVLEGVSQFLGIRREDIDGCLYPSIGGNKLVLFDTVPGGAGHARRLLEDNNMHGVINTTRDYLNQCTCGPETSCYGCLRNYQNQFCHEKLQRGPVLDFLERL